MKALSGLLDAFWSRKRRDWWHMHRTHHPRRSVWSKHRATRVCSGTDEPAKRPFAFRGVLGCEARLPPAQGGMEVCGRLLAFRPPHSTAGENMHKLRSLQRTVSLDTWINHSVPFGTTKPDGFLLSQPPTHAHPQPTHVVMPPGERGSLEPPRPEREPPPRQTAAHPPRAPAH